MSPPSRAVQAPTLPRLRPLVTVDVTILTVRDGRLHVLLVQRPAAGDEPFAGRWALPGGFVDVDRDDTLEQCAQRKLREKTGLDSPWLEQVAARGSRDRDPRGWSVTHLYAALMPDSEPLSAGGNAADVRWHPLDAQGRLVPLDDADSNEPHRRPQLAFDHESLLQEAVARVRSKSEYTDLPVYLLPARFTLPELQAIFEVVLGRPVDKKAFRTRVLASGMLEPLDETRATGRRPAQMFRLRDREGLHYYRRALESGL